MARTRAKAPNPDANGKFRTKVEEDPDVSPQERSTVRDWRKKIDDARKFDENTRTCYALDRRHARNESGSYEVAVPVAPTNIQILKSFLFARNPDLDITPSPNTSPPALADLLDIAMQELTQDPAMQQQIEAAGEQAVMQAMGRSMIAAAVGGMTGGAPPVPGQPPGMPPGPPPDPNAIKQQAMQQMTQAAAKQRANALMAPFRKRLSDAKQFAETLEIVISNLWKKGKLKQAMKPVVGSALTIGIGWIKATWQERSGYDPLTQRAINDAQSLLDQIAEEKRDIAEDEGDTDAEEGRLKLRMQGLKAKKIIVARGMAIDYCDAEDIQVAPDIPSMEFYADAPWIAHRVCMSRDDAEARFPRIAEKLDRATTYFRRKPRDPQEKKDYNLNSNLTMQPGDADSKWTSNQAQSQNTPSGSFGYTGSSSSTTNDQGVAAWEIWAKEDNMVYTVIEGIDMWACDPWAPDPETTRFYPFFMSYVIDVNGERHPDSLIRRTQRLLDDINKLYSNRAEHRRRAIPKIGFDSTRYAKTEIEKLMAGGIGEFVPLLPNKPGEPVNTAFAPIAYPAVDEALYNDNQQRAEIERGWGIQEALASTIQTPKTATEAQIQETGTSARTDFMRDGIDAPLEEFANYTAEVAVQKVSLADAQEMAGPWALWPAIKPSELGQLVEVTIKAGSTGKPNTQQARQSWAILLPILQQAIVQIGQLRGATPDDIADCLDELVSETIRRSGENIDPERFLPRSPAASLPMPAAPTPPPVTLAPLMPAATPAPGPGP